MITSSKAGVRVLVLASLFAMTGLRAGVFALALRVYSLPHSGVWLSATFACTLCAPALLATVGGHLSDRYPRYKVAMISDSISLACWLALSLTGSRLVLIACLLVGSISGSFTGMAISAAIPDFVGEQDVAWAYGLESMAANASSISGPALGALAYSVGGFALAARMTGAGYMASIIVVFSLRSRFRTDARADGEHAGPAAGFRLVWRHSLLRPAIASMAFIYISLNIAMVADLPLVRRLGLGPVAYALIDTCFGVGMLLGGFLARFIRAGTEPRWIALGASGVLASWAAVAVTTPYSVIPAASFTVGVVIALTVAGLYTVIGREAGGAVRTRVIAVVETAGLSATAVALSGAGILVDTVGPRMVYGIGAVSAVLALSILAPTLRRPTARPVADEVLEPGYRG